MSPRTMNDQAHRERRPFIPIWLDAAKLPPVDFRILCNLWRRYNPRRQQCNPSVETIAADCGLNYKTVSKAVQRLKVSGLIKPLGKPFGGSNRYLPIVPPNGTVEVAPIVPPNGTPIVPRDGMPIVPPNGTGRIEREGNSTERNSITVSLSSYLDEPFDCGEDPTSEPLGSENVKDPPGTHGPTIEPVAEAPDVDERVPEPVGWRERLKGCDAIDPFYFRTQWSDPQFREPVKRTILRLLNPPTPTPTTGEAF